ncbi:NAD(P)/FAD-dependent oxidoreductase [Saccharopolyspora mangrovi]|uniref:NAD(P)/FAD-dependent oxidoreductase n=1 Tax=Saccharopolyspora mangrovi TaxID=3082379 RepID=A0ABU6AJ50_9PSEU|nr:NAD(P)/FAD-dependent oxidoreductase [Saccharopolyspora sp. S2-29]MEB3371577.1 NAD(P)/FAD-dependent oxidoreductase [Saccharopolyspora sp. S2-29]
MVAGGGPAGLAVALGCAQAGLDVVVCEKRPGVIDKACGEGLMPGAVRALGALGVDPPGHPIEGITYRQGSTVARAAFRTGSGRGVRRTTLHSALRCAVERHGVPMLTSPIRTFSQHSDHIRAEGLRARYLVAADGLHSTVRELAGLTKVNTACSTRVPRWGLRRHYALAPFTDTVEVTWASQSEAYVTPVGPNTIGVAILSSVRGGFTQQLSAFPDLSARIADAEPISSVRGAGPFRQHASSRVAGRVLLVGDAAGYVDALTGEGLAVSLVTAAELVRCIRLDRPADYERAWERTSRRSRWLTEALLWSRRQPSLARRIVPAAAKNPRLFAFAVDQLAR